MLFRKTVVSLIGLAIIVALACGTPAAIGAEFNVELYEADDIGAAPGLQLPYPSNNNILEVIFFFDNAVLLETTHLDISGFDANNVYDPAIVLDSTYPILPTTAATSFRVSISVRTGTSRVKIRINGGIPSADPTNDDTSKELTVDVGVLDTTRDVTTPATTTGTGGGFPVTPPATPGGTAATGASTGPGPRVYNIRREPASALPLTGGAVTVVITLSEAAQGLNAAHINVTNATAGAPVHLGAVSQNTIGLGTVATHLTSTGAIGAKPPLRTVNQLRSVIKTYMNNTASATPAEFIDSVRALKTAVSKLSTPWTWKYYYLNAAGAQTYKTLADGTPTGYLLFPMVNNTIPMPDTNGTKNLSTTTPITLPIPKNSWKRSKAAPSPPNPLDPKLNTRDKYNQALAVYNALTSSVAKQDRAAYKKEKIAYDKYMVLLKALQAHDVRKQVEWDRDLATTAASAQQVPQDSLPPTGRDNMLHRYSVTITPTYTTGDPVVVKVNRFPNTSIPALYYTPPTLESGYVEGFDKLTLQVAGGAVIVEPAGTIPAAFGLVFAPGHPDSMPSIDQIQEQIDLLIATGDRSPAAMRALAYLQQLLATARPEKTQLLANYPNPFNPETWIPYELATDTYVKITIYNAQGGVVRTLPLGQQSAGYYTNREQAAYWDGRNTLGEQVASGIYFYQLETDTLSSLRKMVILK